jgi:hypothetical protein
MMPGAPGFDNHAVAGCETVADKLVGLQSGDKG